MGMSLRVLLTSATLLLPAASFAVTPGFITDYEGDLTGKSVAHVAGAPTETLFRQPSYSGTTSNPAPGNFATTSENKSEIVADPTGATNPETGAVNNVLRAGFTFLDNNPARWVRLTPYASGVGAVGYNPTLDLTKPLSMRVLVAPADLSAGPACFALGIRETGTTADIGMPGGGAGTIEFVGANGANAIGMLAGPAATHCLTPGAWQDLVFNIPTESIQKFTGNGILDAANNKGIIDSLAINFQNGYAGPVSIYIDDISQAPTGGAIPEPGSMALLASGLLPLLALRRRAR